MPTALLLAFALLSAHFAQAADSAVEPPAQPQPAAPPAQAAPKEEAKPPAFSLLEIYASPNPVEDKTVPTFHVKLTQPADEAELRIYTVTLELLHAAQLKKPAQCKQGACIYEYSWKGISGLSKGVYFFLFRASKKGQAAIKEMKSIKLAR